MSGTLIFCENNGHDYVTTAVLPFDAISLQAMDKKHNKRVIMSNHSIADQVSLNRTTPLSVISITLVT